MEDKLQRLERLLEDIRSWADDRADGVVDPLTGELYPNDEMSIIHRIDQELAR